MKFIADNTGFSVYVSDEKIFRFNAVVSAEIDGKTTTLTPCHFESSGKKYTWKTANGTSYTLSVNETSATFSSTLNVKGKTGNVNFLETDEYYACGYYSPVVGAGGDVGLYKTMNTPESGLSSFFAPYPLCYVFKMEDCEKMLGISLIAKSGEYNFNNFLYNYNDKKISFSIDYAEYLSMNGNFKLPDIVFFEGENRFDILEQYSAAHSGYIKTSQNEVFDWWKKPFLCGWGDQWTIAANENISANAAWDEDAVADAANKKPTGESTFDKAIAVSDEKTYRNIIKKTEEKHIEYGTLIIDCKWQKAFGTMEVDKTKWHDMRKFVDEMHNNGKKVLLWFNFWSCEGLPDDECITKDGIPLYTDPTNPAYAKRMKKIMEYLLSDKEGCCNADGFKVDFVGYTKEKGLNIFKNGVYGIELIRKQAEIIYRCAKKAKKDALISSQYVHPYFADIMDMMRIGDYFGASNRSKENLHTRVGMLNATLPGILTDTDAPSGTNRRDALIYFRYSAKLGIPSIYGIDLYDRFFDDDDWAEVAQIYKDYNSNL